MKRLIVVLVAALFGCSTSSSFQQLEQISISSEQVHRLEKVIARSLESASPSEQFEAVMKLHRAKALAPTHEWSRCIIPLMHILNGENNEPSARILAAMLLHELRTERGDFAISRNARFTDDARVKRYCTILTLTRRAEKAKM